MNLAVSTYFPAFYVQNKVSHTDQPHSVFVYLREFGYYILFGAGLSIPMKTL